jgi:hypothetical protein
MNVSIIKSPADFQPVKSDGLFFVVSADTQSVFSFRYVYNLYIEGQLVFTGKATPNPEGLGVIDVSKVMNSYLVNSPIALKADLPIFWHQTSIFSRPYSNLALTYYIEVGEEHATTASGSIQQYTGIGTSLGSPGVPSLDFRSYMGTLPVNYIANTQDFNYGPFVMSGVPTNYQEGLFMTNSPRQRDITTDDYYTLSFANYKITQGIYSEPYVVKYTFFDDEGSQLAEYSWQNLFNYGGGPAQGCYDTYPCVLPTGTRSSDFNILNVAAGPKNIPNIPSGTSYYHIQLFGNKNTAPAPTATPTTTPTPTQTPTPSSTPAVCNVYEVTNDTGGKVTENIEDCNGNIIVVTLGSGETTNICVENVPLSTFTWVLLGTCPTCACVDVTFSGDSRSRTLYYTDCDNNLISLSLAPFGSYNTCICDVSTWTGTGITIAYNGPCGATTPTPTPTPSATPITGTTYARFRNCCDPDQYFDAEISERVSFGQVISYNGACWQFTESPISGTSLELEYQIYGSCSSCLFDYPCSTTEDISVLKPDVEPSPNTPVFSGTGFCVNYSAVSEVFQFNLVDNCSEQFGQLQLMFRNRYGSYDYYRFFRGKSEALSIERQTYQQYNQTWGQDNILKTTYSRGLTNFALNITEFHTINSGFISQSDMVYLQELYTSDDVYEIKPDGTLFPINITNEEFIIKNKGEKQLVNLELTYVYANNIRGLGL